MSTKLKQMSALLAVDLVNLPEHFVVIFRRGGKYALARGAAECLVIETSSNLDLEGGDLQLSPSDEASLQARGWHAPNPPWVLGWFRKLPWPLSGTAALSASEMLIDVIEMFPAPSDEPLEVVAFDLRNNEPLDLESMHRIRAACQDR